MGGPGHREDGPIGDGRPRGGERPRDRERQLAGEWAADPGAGTHGAEQPHGGERQLAGEWAADPDAGTHEGERQHGEERPGDGEQPLTAAARLPGMPPSAAATAPAWHGGRRYVEVAVDAAGAGGDRTYTYEVPDALGDLVAGEAVLVEYGRRQALGIVLAEQPEPPDVAIRPIAARVRSDGPLLPPLQLALAREIADHYLAPPALAVRAFLPPGLLERLELVAYPATPSADAVPVDAAPFRREAAPPATTARRRTANDRDEGRLLARVEAAGTTGVRVRDLPADEGRAALVRRLRGLATAGRIVLEWRLGTPGVTPRLERVVALTEAGSEAAALLAGGGRLEGRPLGPRQAAALADLAAAGGIAVDGDAPVEPPDGGPNEEGSPGPWRAAAPLAARHGAGAIQGLGRRGLVRIEVVERGRRPLAGRARSARGSLPAGAELTPAQAAATAPIVEAVRARLPAAFLLEGVTAAGKTAVYAASIAAALEAGRGALALVPEIALATPLLERLRADLGVEIALLHGALGAGERTDEWRRIRAGAVSVVVGTRTAILAPLGDPGVVIVDEEQEAAYKSDRTPRYQARDVALRLGRLAEAPVVLGSATPDVATVARARNGTLRHLVLPERAAGAGATVELVDLRAELAAGNRGLLSGALVDALGALDVEAGDRAILVINRRGSASVVICRDCGYVQVCPECRRPLVYHASAAVLRCHHCGATAPIAQRCPACGSSRIRYLGGGTERLEREVRERFRGLRVARLDRDVLARKGAGDRVLDALRDGAIDVLVGTSIVAKGIDVPEVTLVGVVSADIALNLPDARAAERTYQFLAQAVGRAGRGERGGRAIIQTYQPDHPAVRAVADGDPAEFYEAELEARRAFGFPPFGELVKLTVGAEELDEAEDRARRYATELRERALSSGRDVSVLGPVPAYVARRGGRWRFHVVLRGVDPVGLLGQAPGQPWSVDVDPESLL